MAGYEDVNDAERLACDPAMRAIIGREGLDRSAASSSEMGRFGTGWPPTEANLAALTDLSRAGSRSSHPVLIPALTARFAGLELTDCPSRSTVEPRNEGHPGNFG